MDFLTELKDMIMRIMESFFGSENSVFNAIRDFFDNIFGGAAE